MSDLKAVLFDLDGTLVDTAPDMVRALNLLLQKYQHADCTFDSARYNVSRGSLAMIKHGFGEDHSPQQLTTWQQEFLEIYHQHLCIDSALFPGMDAVLQQLESEHIPWGIVTNKPGWLAEPLLEALALQQRSACLVSGDTLEKRKPHPDPLLHACQLLGLRPQQCVYIGDDRRDVEAANAAAMPVIVALYGYIHPQEMPLQWETSHNITAPVDIIPWLDRYRSHSQQTP